MRIESFTRAKNQIINFFDEKGPAFTSNDLTDIFYNNKENWNIAEYRRPEDFFIFLEKEEILILDNLFDNVGTKKRIWKKKESNNFDIALTIKKDGYLSNYSAMYLLGITLQIPKTTYVTTDKSQNKYSLSNNSELEQESVDKAFSKPQRTASDSYKSQLDNYRYTFLQKKNNSINIGVIDQSNRKITDLERTLIDIAVRPSYSGGVFEVLSAFVTAKEKGIDLLKLDKYLNNLDYIYPYHQLIGFYLEKCGIPKVKLKLFSEKISDIDFYLTYNMNTKDYNTYWKLYYPRGF